MDYEITPEPSEEERRAILAALAAEDAERPSVPPWAARLLPRPAGEPAGDLGSAPDA